MVKKLRYVFDRKDKIKLVGLAILMVIGSVLELLAVAVFNPFIEVLMQTSSIEDDSFLKLFFTHIHLNGIEQYLVVLSALIAVIYLVKNIYLSFLQNVILSFSYTTRMNLATRLLTTYMNEPYTFHLSKNIAEMQRCLQSDTSQFMSLINSCLQLTVEMVTCLALAAYLFHTSHSITVVIGVLLLLCIGLFFMISKKVSSRLGRQNENYNAKLFQWINQSLGGIKELKILQREEYFIDSYETLKGRNIEEEDREFLQRKFDKMYVTKDIYAIYNKLLAVCGQEQMAELPYERRKIQYEDVFPMLYVKYRLTGKNEHKNIKHLVIDEMQDYSYLQYLILKELFDCKMTILGDRAQTLGKEQQDVLKFLPKVFGKNIRTVILNKSYRNTREIADYAGKIANVKDIEFLDRHGKDVAERKFKTDEEMFEAVRANLKLEKEEKTDHTDDVVNEEVYETAAVIAMTEEEASDIYRLLENRGISAFYVDRDTSVFHKGLTVTTYYLAKGLEFDQVFVVKSKKENPFEKQALYISATRALHELYVYEE